ncbi:MAG: DUF502 domain-containing protein [Candidatus Omnitrophica bacterium]|nr:DUF502 domain-containing protein [Candidatus Omnitrophota bacterium]
MLNKIKSSFFTGLVLILPLVLTIAIISGLVKQINEKVLSPAIELLGLTFYNPYWTHMAKAIAFVMAILLIALVGAATRSFLLRKFFGFWEGILAKVPAIGKIYTTIKEISRALLGQGKLVFEKVVLIEYPRKGVYSIAFLTQEASKEIKEKTASEAVYVFLPTTPNPTNGYFLVIPKNDIIPLNMSVAEGLKLVVSGGTVTPADKNS